MLPWLGVRHSVAQELSSRAEVVYTKNRIALSDLRIPERWPLPLWFLLMLTYADQATTPNATWIYIFYCNSCASCTAHLDTHHQARPLEVVLWSGARVWTEIYIGCKCTVVNVVHFLLPQVRKSCKSKAWLVEASKLASCALWSFTDFECQWCQWCHFPIWAPGVFPHVCHSPWPALHRQLELRVAKAWTLRGLRLELQSCNCLQLAAPIKTPEPVFISFPYFSFTCRLVGVGSRASGMAGNWSMAEHLKFEGFQSAGRASRVQ